MALVRPVGSAGQAMENSRCIVKFQEASVTPLGPGTKTTTKTSPSENLANQLQTSQELASRTTGQNHTTTAVPRDKTDQGLAPVRPIKNTSQTGHTWTAQDEQRPQVNSLKSNSRSPDSLHGFAQDFGDSRNTSWALHSIVMVHQNSLNQEESLDFRQEHHEP
jgi:hypothetical protein